MRFYDRSFSVCFTKELAQDPGIFARMRLWRFIANELRFLDSCPRACTFEARGMAIDADTAAAPWLRLAPPTGPRPSVAAPSESAQRLSGALLELEIEFRFQAGTWVAAQTWEHQGAQATRATPTRVPDSTAGFWRVRPGSCIRGGLKTS